MKRFNTISSGFASAILFVGCASTPENHSAVDQAQSELDQLASQAYVQRHAPQRLERARDAVKRAEEAWRTGENEQVVEHLAYLADRRIDIAREAAALGRAEQTVQHAEAERQQVLLEIREADAQAARARAERVEGRARQLEQALSSLESDMATLESKQTDEGIVLTLRDILFDVGEAELSASADSTLEKVAAFLNRYPDRQLYIKGFTDNAGSETFNLGLSERRAQSVEEALTQLGVDPGRIRTEGYGERNPVASNDSVSGRQQNRRVEILIEDTMNDAVTGL